MRNSIHQLSVRWEHWDLDSESPAHTPQRPRECPQLHTRVWSHSSTEAKVSSKTDMSQLRAKCLRASPEKCPCPGRGAALHPLPLSCQLGHLFRALGGLGGGSRTQLQPQIHTECQSQGQARWPCSHLGCREGPSQESQAWPLHTAGPGTEKGLILSLIWKMGVSIQGTAGGFSCQWLMQKGMPVCCHKPEWVIPPAPTGTGPVQHPRFFTATQDSEYICSMWPVKYFLTKHHRSRFYLQ